MHKITGIVALALVTLGALAGCATEVTPDEAEPEPAPLPAVEAETVAPEQANLTGPCTVTTTCSGAYCCTTTDCRFTTTVECKGRAVKAYYP